MAGEKLYFNCLAKPWVLIIYTSGVYLCSCSVQDSFCSVQKVLRKFYFMEFANVECELCDFDIFFYRGTCDNMNVITHLLHIFKKDFHQQF